MTDDQEKKKVLFPSETIKKLSGIARLGAKHLLTLGLFFMFVGLGKIVLDIVVFIGVFLHNLIEMVLTYGEEKTK